MINKSNKELQEMYLQSKTKKEKNLKTFYDFNSEENVEFNLENIKKSVDINSFGLHKKAILIGEVQSGKTNNLIKLVDYVIKNKIYQHIVWLSGTNKNLAYQSFSRYVNTSDTEFYQSDIYFYDSQQDKNSEGILVDSLSQNKIVISMSLKESSHLKKIVQAFEKANTFGKKILVIDDECDYFSIENNQSSNQKNEKKEKISSLIQKILEMNNYSKSFYLGVTATPYSNFNYKLNSKLFPDEAIILNTNFSAYTGLNWFNKYKDNIYVVSKDSKQSQSNIESLMLGILAFINSYIIRKKEGLHSELLINIDLDNKVQIEILNSINYIISLWINNISYNREKTILLFKEKYEQLKVDTFNIEEVIEVINNFFKLFPIYLLNSSESTDNSIRSYTSGRESCVVIGGVMVSRGFTFENLTTEVMLNAPVNKIKIDILLQRARWFGYRRPMKSYIKVIMNQKLIDAFSEAQEISDAMKNHFKNNWIINDINVLYNNIKLVSGNHKVVEVG